MYKLIISNVSDRPKAAMALRKLFHNWNIKLAMDVVSHIPFSISEAYFTENEVRAALDGIVEYQYIKELEPYDPKCDPPWLKPEYQLAKAWYDSLPKEDQEKIDILVNNSGPWA